MKPKKIDSIEVSKGENGGFILRVNFVQANRRDYHRPITYAYGQCEFSEVLHKLTRELNGD
jgi:hypothetical protein